MSYPYLIWNTSEDIVLQLPKSIEDYRAQLGKQTQKHIKYYINRLGRDHGDFTFRVTASNEVDSSSIIRIIEMNRLRMASKHMVSGIDHAYEKNIIEFSKKYGLIGTLAVGDKIIAGAICYEVGDHSYLHVIAHDPAYNKYNAGQVCLYLTIKTLIEREKRVFHMLWGESEYKYRFLGVKQKLSFVRIYRSPLSRHIGIMNHMIAHFKNYFVLRCVAPFLAPVRKMMPFLRTIKNAMFLFFTLNWKELYVRTCVALGHIDLGMTSLDELNLSAERSNFYSDSRCAELDTVLATLRISSSDAVIDFGCGKGGALITLSRYPFSKITGVEISDRLVVIARENLRKLRLRNVTVVHSDAADFRDLDDYNIVYLFNPFPCPVMQSVMDNLRKSIERKPRKVTIIYLNPVCHDELVSDSLFVKRREFDHPSHKYYIYSNQP